VEKKSPKLHHVEVEQFERADTFVPHQVGDAGGANHPGVTPQLMGQIFHYFEAPNRFGLPAFYTLHVWAWKENPKGAFVNWHPNVSCQSFVGQTTP
jgi:hypothetical protein